MQRIWEVAAHYFRVCLDGHWPVNDFSGSVWPVSSVRAKSAGKPLFEYKGVAYHAVLTEISADLDEYAKTLGLPHYSSSHPCIRCFRALGSLGDMGVQSKKRSQQWVQDSAESNLRFYEVDDRKVRRLLDNVEGKHQKGGLIVQNSRDLQDIFPGIRNNDRIEPTLNGFPDIVHGEVCSDYPPDRRKILVYRRDPGLLLFFNRLFPMEGVCEGVPNLSIEYFIFDSMHVIELGILHYLLGYVLCLLIECGFFGKLEKKTMRV